MIDPRAVIEPGKAAAGISIGDPVETLIHAGNPARLELGDGFELLDFGAVRLWVKAGMIDQIGVREGYSGSITGTSIGVGSTIQEVLDAIGPVVEDEEDNLIVANVPGMCFETAAWSGALVAIGSDWPTGAIDANPLRMIQVVVTRKNPYEKTADEPLGETISLEDAIRAMTLGGAYSMRKENELGSIEKGKAADMVVLDRDLFEIDPESIIETQVLYTIFAGKIVYPASM